MPNKEEIANGHRAPWTAASFSGGITPPGGHEGDNAGSDAIEALVTGTGKAPARRAYSAGRCLR